MHIFFSQSLFDRNVHTLLTTDFRNNLENKKGGDEIMKNNY